jgi:4,5-dihydroxyphthalate decarboxylase
MAKSQQPSVNRRGFLASAAAGAAAMVRPPQQATPAPPNPARPTRPDVSTNGKLALTLSCWDYDRTRALRDGRVSIDGVDLTYLALPIEETFFRMLRYQDFDVSEMSLSSYTLSLFQDNPPFIAIPVFPSRYFRHSCIFVNANSGIRQPRDLAGKRIGNPEYQMTAPVWIRGILSDEYGVSVTSPTYWSGGEEEPGRSEKIELSLPTQFRVQSIPETKTLSQMIETGEIDALYTARAPSTFMSNTSGKVRQLFPDYSSVERAYYQKTKIFPIMHTIVIRRELYERHRWIAQSLYKAFVLSQRAAYEDLHETAALKTMLPFLLQHVEETEKLFGKDFWPYGLDANLNTLNTFLRYSYEQGLSKRQLTPRELFAPESLESFKI